MLLHWHPRTNKTAVFAKRARAMAQEIYSHVYINLPKIAKKLANFHTATMQHFGTSVFFLQTKFGKGPILDEKHPNRVSLPKNALVFHSVCLGVKSILNLQSYFYAPAVLQVICEKNLFGKVLRQSRRKIRKSRCIKIGSIPQKLFNPI